MRFAAPPSTLKTSNIGREREGGGGGGWGVWRVGGGGGGGADVE